MIRETTTTTTTTMRTKEERERVSLCVLSFLLAIRRQRERRVVCVCVCVCVSTVSYLLFMVCFGATFRETFFLLILFFFFVHLCLFSPFVFFSRVYPLSLKICTSFYNSSSSSSFGHLGIISIWEEDSFGLLLDLLLILFFFL